MSAVLKVSELTRERRMRWEEDWLIFALGRASEYRMRIANRRLEDAERNAAEFIRQTALTAARMHLRKLRAMGWKPTEYLSQRIEMEGV